MAEDDETGLVARFAAGDEQAVRWVYERYAGPILTVALSILGRRDLADEAVQTTLLKAWRAADTFDTSRELAPWLYTIARRVSIDIYRREQCTPVTPLEDHDVAVVPLAFEQTWEAWEVRNALDQLPPDEREVARLSHLVGLSHREIAEQLGVPLGTVKSRSARAHQRLARSLRHVVGTVEDRP
jgi:RNA polymerase sigma factor (sigma-70 family)